MNSSILVYRKVQPRSHQAPFPLSTHSLVVLPGRLLCLLLFWYTKASSRVQAPGEHTNFCRRSLSHVRPRARDLRAPACPSARQAASGVGSVLYEQHASALGQDAARSGRTQPHRNQRTAAQSKGARRRVGGWWRCSLGRSQARPSYLSNALAWASVPFLSVVPVGRPLVPVGRPVARRPLARRSAPRRRRPQDARQYTTEERAGGRWDRRRGSVACGRWARPVVDQPWQSALRNARERGAPPRERTDRRPCDIPTGLEPGRWPCVPGGARQSGGGAAAERGREPTTARARRKVYRLGQFVCFFDSCSLTSNCNTDD